MLTPVLHYLIVEITLFLMNGILCFIFWGFGNRYVFGTAIIHKEHLVSWINPTFFASLNPSRVKIMDSFVVIQGPAWIASSPLQAFILKVAFIVNLIFFGLKFGNWFHSTNAEVNVERESEEEETLAEAIIRSYPISIIYGIALGILGWTLLSKIMPGKSEISLR